MSQHHNDICKKCYENINSCKCSQKCKTTGKTKYRNSCSANEALLKLKASVSYLKNGRRVKHRKRKVSQTRVYFCTSCKSFHLTSIKNFNQHLKKINEKKEEEKNFFSSFNLNKWKENSLPFPIEKL